MIDSNIPIVLGTRIYIYALVDPRNGDVRYIGQSLNPKLRYKQHMTMRKDVEFVNWWLEVIDPGYDVIMSILCDAEPHEADATEQQAIDMALSRGHKLFNVRGTERNHATEYARITPLEPTPHPPRLPRPQIYVPPRQVSELTYLVSCNSSVFDPKLGYNARQSYA